jgi:hypothetical protein
LSVIRLPWPRFSYRNSSRSLPTVCNIYSGISHTTRFTLATSAAQRPDAAYLNRNSDPPQSR